ncbi:hypothetical protein RQP46_002641 [Phenoliferia psychrophenolica]
MPATPVDVQAAAARLQFTIPQGHEEDYLTLLQATEAAAETLLAIPGSNFGIKCCLQANALHSEYLTPVDTARFPRLDVHRPDASDNALRGWAWKVKIQGAPSGILKGKTVCAKDTVCVRDVPLLFGTHAISGYIHHVGPMARTVLDAALLLEALAGYDGIDDRQLGAPLPVNVLKYSEIVLESRKNGIKGMRIALLKEGFEHSSLDSNVDAAVRAAIAKFVDLGAVVEEVSVPLHKNTEQLCHIINKFASSQTRQGRQVGRRGLYLVDYWKKLLPWTQEKYDLAKYFVTGTSMSAEHGWSKYPTVYGHAMNLSRRLRDEYDAVLATFDVVIMPTVTQPPRRHVAPDAGPLAWARAAPGIVSNTAASNLTGHPTLTIPCGFTPPSPADSPGDESIHLPCGMMLMGKLFDEATVLTIIRSVHMSLFTTPTSDWLNTGFGISQGLPPLSSTTAPYPVLSAAEQYAQYERREEAERAAQEVEQFSVIMSAEEWQEWRSWKEWKASLQLFTTSGQLEKVLGLSQSCPVSISPSLILDPYTLSGAFSNFEFQFDSLSLEEIDEGFHHGGMDLFAAPQSVRSFLGHGGGRRTSRWGGHGLGRGLDGL